MGLSIIECIPIGLFFEDFDNGWLNDDDPHDDDDHFKIELAVSNYKFKKQINLQW